MTAAEYVFCDAHDRRSHAQPDGSYIHPMDGSLCKQRADLDDVAAVLDAFERVQPSDGGVLKDGVIELETVRDHVVVAYPGPEGWWSGRLDVRSSDGTTYFSVPLLQGPVWYADSDSTLQDVVDWLRTITDSGPDVEEPSVSAHPAWADMTREQKIAHLVEPHGLLTGEPGETWGDDPDDNELDDDRLDALHHHEHHGGDPETPHVHA